MKKMKKSNLDERQEQELLRIERNGFWLAFWLLVGAMLVQQIFFLGDSRVIAGECIILLIISLYIAISCLKAGIWDRRLKANASTNIIASLIAGLVMGVVMFLAVYRTHMDKPIGSIAAGAFIAILVFVLCFIALTISMRAYKKKTEALEEEPEDDMEM